MRIGRALALGLALSVPPLGRLVAQAPPPAGSAPAVLFVGGRRPGPAGPGHRQPAGQRRQVHPRRRAGDPCRRGLPGPGQALATVADTGCGIEPKQIPRLFEAFAQDDRRVAQPGRAGPGPGPGEGSGGAARRHRAGGERRARHQGPVHRAAPPRPRGDGLTLLRPVALLGARPGRNQDRSGQALPPGSCLRLRTAAAMAEAGDHRADQPRRLVLQGLVDGRGPADAAQVYGTRVPERKPFPLSPRFRPLPCQDEC